MTTDIVFPYGTFPVDEAFRGRYTQDYLGAGSYPLPTHLPSHHPLLRQIEGTYLLENALPPWWPACVAQVRPEALRPLLSSISAHEFRTGCIEQARWKAFRESLSNEQRRALPSSPKIAALVEYTGWAPYFGSRGPIDTPDQLSLVISTHPRDFLYMSNGHEWHSCQHFSNGCQNHRLPGNFYDTGVAVAMVLVPNTNVEAEASVLVRTTLRVFPHQGKILVVIGRTYHNNETLALLLLCKLAEIFDAQKLCWGFMLDVNTLAYCEEGFLGPALAKRLEQSIMVDSEPFWLPRSWYPPYIDGGDHDWLYDREAESQEYLRPWLNATVKLMRPLASHLLSTSTQPPGLARFRRSCFLASSKPAMSGRFPLFPGHRKNLPFSNKFTPPERTSYELPLPISRPSFPVVSNSPGSVPASKSLRAGGPGSGVRRGSSGAARIRRFC